MNCIMIRVLCVSVYMACVVGCVSESLNPVEQEDAGTGPLRIVQVAESEPIVLADGSGTIVVPGFDVPAGNGAVQTLSPIDGATLREVRFRIQPAPHQSIDGEGLPFIEVRRLDLDDGSAYNPLNPATSPVAQIGEDGRDDSSSPIAYSTPHDLVVSDLSEHIDRSRFLYFVYFSQEAGGGAAVAGAVIGARSTYSMPQ